MNMNEKMSITLSLGMNASDDWVLVVQWDKSNESKL